ncbi:MAG: peptidoglycan-binding domain-containing protein [Bacteroidota bacterium]
MSNTTLRLGKVDQGQTPTDIGKFFTLYHASLSPALKGKLKFRDEGNSSWRAFDEVMGHEVKDLQLFLKEAGFMNSGKVDGIFGYKTHAAVRLFQEYIRTVENDPSIGTPDGIVGRNTYRFIDQWKREKSPGQQFKCSWAQSSAAKPSAEFTEWINLLTKAKNHYLANPHPILKYLEDYQHPSDTHKIKDWDTSPETIHLIGIRRNQDMSTTRRENDDVFVLLINGLVFKFWGSTDPSQSMAFNFTKNKGRKDEPFLIEGQHIYKFGWHKISDGRKVYRALKPAKYGVMVFRDRDNNDALTEADILKGLDERPNLSINIHWSGKGQSNYSAGCQVIAGQSYINPDGKIINCSNFASPSYNDLSLGKTRGAYNMLTDLLLNFAPPKVYTIAYMLSRDETFFLSNKIDDKTIEGWANSMRNI